MFILSMFLTILFIMVGVAYLTLMERKVLSYIQLWKGPNSVGFIGILQPFSDAIKLFLKEHSMPLLSNYMIYILVLLLDYLLHFCCGQFIHLLLIVALLILVFCCFFFVVLEWQYME